jgi:hypothetical protein
MISIFGDRSSGLHSLLGEFGKHHPAICPPHFFSFTRMGDRYDPDDPDEWLERQDGTAEIPNPPLEVIPNILLLPGIHHGLQKLVWGGW